MSRPITAGYLSVGHTFYLHGVLWTVTKRIPMAYTYDIQFEATNEAGHTMDFVMDYHVIVVVED